MESGKIIDEKEVKNVVIVKKGLFYYLVALVRLIFKSIFFVLKFFYSRIASQSKYMFEVYSEYGKNKKFNKSLYRKPNYNEEIL